VDKKCKIIDGKWVRSWLAGGGITEEPLAAGPKQRKDRRGVGGRVLLLLLSKKKAGRG